MDKLGLGSVLTEDPAWTIDFAPNGTRVGLGDTLTRRRYAELLDTIAPDGADAFYSGDIAASTIRAITSHDGIIAIEDLKNYQAIWQAPYSLDYRTFRLKTNLWVSRGWHGLSPDSEYCERLFRSWRHEVGRFEYSSTG
jgi:gamma-glutamyltranspeptidase/glutathione hydrolase